MHPRLLGAALALLACAPHATSVIDPLPACTAVQLLDQAWTTVVIDSSGSSIRVPTRFKPDAKVSPATPYRFWRHEKDDTFPALIAVAHETAGSDGQRPAPNGAVCDTVAGRPLAVTTGYSPGDIWPHYYVDGFWYLNPGEGLRIRIEGSSIASQRIGLAMLRTLKP